MLRRMRRKTIKRVGRELVSLSLGGACAGDAPARVAEGRERAHENDKLPKIALHCESEASADGAGEGDAREGAAAEEGGAVSDLLVMPRWSTWDPLFA